MVQVGLLLSDVPRSVSPSDQFKDVLRIVEASLDPDLPPDVEALQIPAGADALQDYLSRVSSWVSAAPPDGDELTDEAVAHLFGPGPSGGTAILRNAPTID